MDRSFIGYECGLAPFSSISIVVIFHSTKNCTNFQCKNCLARNNPKNLTLLYFLELIVAITKNIVPSSAGIVYS